MENNELDDLFRSNADYLADEPVRDFDKAAFWQQLQTGLPKKAERERAPAAWWWAAASVLLVGVFGGIWWMQSAQPEVETLSTQEVNLTEKPASLESTPLQTRVAEARSQTSARGSKVEHAPSSRRRELANGNREPERNYSLTILPDPPPPTRVAVEPAAIEQPIPIILPVPVEVVGSVAHEEPALRVVHINEIRERKQQEAKARSRVAFRIGLPPGSQITTPSDNKTLLNIPIQR